MKCVLVFSVLIAIAASVFAADDASSEIDGDWQLVSICKDDETKQITDEARVRLAGGKLVELENAVDKDTADQDHAADTDDYEGGFRCDAQATPKQFDLILTHDGKERDRFEGIYRLNGDELTICFSISSDIVCGFFDLDDGPRPANSPRPGDFEPQGHISLKLKRVAPGKTP